MKNSRRKSGSHRWMDVVELGAFLKRQRILRSMSQRELAEKLGYTPQYVANWERGVAGPPFDLLPEIGAALGIHPHQLVKLLIKGFERKLKERFLYL